MLPFSSLTPRTQCFNSYENHQPATKKAKQALRKNTDHESDFYSASNYYPILSEEAKAIAETDCQQGLDKILDEQTFYVKTRALQRFHLESTVGDQIHNFPWLKNVCIHQFFLSDLNFSMN